jgi:hypothetical protein
MDRQERRDAANSLVLLVIGITVIVEDRRIATGVDGREA